MSDVNISKYRAQVIRQGSTPASPGFAVAEGQNPVDPSGSGQTHLPVTIATATTGLSITESQILSGAGLVSQYIRGDGSLADFPATTGGGSSVSYYLNGSVSQGTIGGVAYKQLNRTPVFGAGTDFTINADGYIASFITDASDPNKLLIPAGNWNFETYFSASSSGGSPSFYVELYKYDGTTFTLIATSSSAPELIAFGTSLNPYYSTLAVPQTTLALTDRLAIRYFVTHSGRTITLHTEDNHLCQIITTFTTGLTALNGLTAQVQNFAVGTSGTDFAIASATATHTFNLPTASATNRGALSSADWTTFNNKQNALTNPVTGTGTTNYLPKFTGASTIGNSNIQDNGSLVSVGVAANFSSSVTALSLDVISASGVGSSAATGLARFITAGTSNGIAVGQSNSSRYTAILANEHIIYNDDFFMRTNGNFPLSIGTNNTTNLRFFSDGNILIQTGGTFTNNGAKLQVSGTATFSSSVTASGSGSFMQADFFQTGSTPATSGGIRLGTQVAIRARNVANTANIPLIESTASDAVAIASDGANVGIGTNSPSVKLQVGVSSNTTTLYTDASYALRLQNASTTNNSYVGMYFSSGAGIGATIQTIFPSPLTNFEGHLTFSTRDSSANIYERMRITSGGNVGIGTTSTVHKLQVNGTIYGNNGATGIAYLLQGTQYNGSIAPLSVSNSYSLGYSTDAITHSNVLTWNASGNVLIGTTTDAGYKTTIAGGGFGLLVYGGTTTSNAAILIRDSANTVDWFKIRGGDAYTQAIGVYNNTSGGGANVVVTSDGGVQRSTSSIKYKREIKNAWYGLSELMKLRPVTYKSKNERDGELIFGGLIAEEVHESGLTEFVQYAKDGTPDALSYGNMASLFVKAIQELKQEIDTLKN